MSVLLLYLFPALFLYLFLLLSPFLIDLASLVIAQFFAAVVAVAVAVAHSVDDVFVLVGPGLFEVGRVRGGQKEKEHDQERQGQ